MKLVSLQEAMKAQAALRSSAGLEPEQFPVEAFVGMISDEVQALREKGKSDLEIVQIISTSSGISLTEKELSDNYADQAFRSRKPKE